MGFISYLVTVLISFLGLAAGIALSYIVNEEIKPGKKYFTVMQNLLFVAISLTVIYVLGFSWIPWFIIVGSMIYILAIDSQRTKVFAMYLLLAALLWVSAQRHAQLFMALDLFPAVASMIFLIGIPTGSLLFDIKKKNIGQVLLTNIHYVTISVILYFV
jgi:hypothetical protein